MIRHPLPGTHAVHYLEEQTRAASPTAPTCADHDRRAGLGPLRLGLYRRIAALADPREIDAFVVAELIDRFGPLPVEVENLLEIIAIRRACRDSGIERVEAGDYCNRFANPPGSSS